MCQITFLTPYVPDGQRAVERIFGCNYGLYPMPNVFVLYSAAQLEQKGYAVRIVDSPLEGWTETDYRNYLSHDDSQAYIIYSTLLAREMDITTHRILREIKSDTPVIYTGPAPTSDPNHYLPDTDTYVVRGEPEITILDLINTIIKQPNSTQSAAIDNIPGVSFRSDESLVNIPSSGVIENLDSLPHPARHLVDPGRYFSPKFGVSPVTAMLTSRGCTAQCIYCVPCSLSFAREIEFKKSNIKKPPVRIRSAQNVVDEINQIASDGYKAVNIIDDQFIWGEKRTTEIAEAFKRHNLAWGCLSRADMITEPIAKILSKTNCKFVDLGVESFDQEILDYIKKGVTVEQTETAIRLLKKYKVFVKANILIGSSPLETKESIIRTVKRTIELDVDSIMIGATNPFPDTHFYELAKENEWFINEDYYPTDSQREWVMEYPHFTREDMEEMLKWANRRFFFRPKFFFRQIHRLKNPADFARTVKTFFKKTGWIWN